VCLRVQARHHLHHLRVHRSTRWNRDVDIFDTPALTVRVVPPPLRPPRVRASAHKALLWAGVVAVRAHVLPMLPEASAGEQEPGVSS